VHEVVPKDQLIVLNLPAGDGYPELCRGLGVPPESCPKEPFPRVNSQGEVDGLRTSMLAMEAAMYVVFALVVFWAWRRLGSATKSAPVKAKSA
jgi:hypothetical protein